MRKILNCSLLFFAVILLLINFYGMLFGEYDVPKRDLWGMGVNDKVVSKLEVEDLDKLGSESDLTYFKRVTKLVNDYIIHGPPEEIAIWDNYILWAFDILRPQTKYFKETYNIERSINKGVGLCSQHSKMIIMATRKNGYESQLVRLYGHVVATIKDHNGKWYIADGDYGVLIPFSLNELENNPAKVSLYYDPVYETVPAEIQLPMLEFYGTPEDNQIIDPTREEGWKMYYFEIMSDYMKWILPIFLLIIPIFSIYWKNK